MKLRGIIPAIVTPMHGDESLNLPELERQVNRQIAAGVAAVFCLGTNGEFFALTYDEKIEVMKTTIQAAAGRVPVIAGTGCVTTAETIALTKAAKEAGADAVSIVSPYFAEVSQPGLAGHFEAVADAVDIPIIIYNIPARTGVNITYQTIKRLSAHPNIIGVKDSSGNYDNTLRYIEETPEDFIVLCGNDSLILWTLMAGGQGGISGIANLFPERMVSIVSLFDKGAFKEAKEVQDSIRTIRDTLKLDNPNSVVKYAANLLGHPVGPVRRPFALREENAQAIQKALSTYSVSKSGGA